VFLFFPPSLPFPPSLRPWRRWTGLQRLGRNHSSASRLFFLRRNAILPHHLLPPLFPVFPPFPWIADDRQMSILHDPDGSPPPSPPLPFPFVRKIGRLKMESGGYACRLFPPAPPPPLLVRLEEKGVDRLAQLFFFPLFLLSVLSLFPRADLKQVGSERIPPPFLPSFHIRRYAKWPLPPFPPFLPAGV